MYLGFIRQSNMGISFEYNTDFLYNKVKYEPDVPKRMNVEYTQYYN